VTSYCRAVPSLLSKRFNLQLVVVTALTFFGVLVGRANAQSSGFYIYPSKGQSQAQRNKDKYECNTWAVSQTAGFALFVSRPKRDSGDLDRG
jgi:hypothetical protein